MLTAGAEVVIYHYKYQLQALPQPEHISITICNHFLLIRSIIIMNKYLTFLFCLALIRAAVVITPMPDDAPRPLIKKEETQPNNHVLTPIQTSQTIQTLTPNKAFVFEQQTILPINQSEVLPKDPPMKPKFEIPSPSQEYSTKPHMEHHKDHSHGYHHGPERHQKSHGGYSHEGQPQRGPQMRREDPVNGFHGNNQGFNSKYNIQDSINDDMELICIILGAIIPAIFMALCCLGCAFMVRRRTEFLHRRREQARAQAHVPYFRPMNVQSLSAQIKYHEDEVNRLRMVVIQQQQRRAVNEANNGRGVAYPMRQFNYPPAEMNYRQRPEMMAPQYNHFSEDSGIPVRRNARQEEVGYPQL